MKRWALPLALTLALAAAAWAGSISGYNQVTGDGTGSTSGYLCTVEAITSGVGAPRVLTASESGLTVTNEGAGALVYVTLPSAAPGYCFTFHVEDATWGIRVTASGGDVIEFGGLESAAGGYLESATHGSGLTLTAIGTSEWVVTVLPAGSRHTWTIDGAATGFGAHAGYWFSTPAETTNGVNDIVKAAGTTSTVNTPDAFTHSGSNRLTYTGLATRDFVVTASVSVTKAAGAGTLTAVTIAEGGTPVTGAIVDRQVGGTDEGAVAVQTIVTLSTNEYIELWCRSSTGNNLTIQSGVVTVVAASTN